MLDLADNSNVCDALPPNDSSLRLEDQLCFRLYTATHAMTRVYRPLLSQLGLTYSQFLVLMALWENDGQTVSGLGDALLLDSGTLSPVLKRLESAGLVTKTRQRQDERQVEIALTAQGRGLQAAAAKVRQQVACRVSLSPADVRTLHRGLDQLLAVLKAEVAEADAGAMAAGYGG